MSEQTTITANELLDGGLLGPAHSDTKVAPARLLEYAPGKRFALPIHTTLEIVEDPEFFHVPGIAQHGLGLLNWQENWIAAVDLSMLLDGVPTPDADKPKYVLVLAFQRAPGEALDYAAVVLPELPQTIFVSDEFFCDLPTDNPIWPEISLSCFSHQGAAIPIVDTGKLFGRSYG